MIGEPKATGRNDYTINSVQTALSILRLFIPRNEPLSLIEISRQLNINKSTALRMAANLTMAGFLKASPETRKYLLGPVILQLGLAAHDSLNLRAVSAAILAELANATNCIVHLGINEQNTVVVVDKVLPDKHSFSIRSSQIGGIMPTFCTGIGLLFLSQESDDAVRRYLGGIERFPYTPTTITDIDAIITRIHQIRLDGYAVNNGEHEEGILSIAYPIRDRSGRIIAGISISGIREVLRDMDLQMLHRQARDAAAEITRQLGGSF